MKYLTFLAFLASCSILTPKVAEDVIEGEIGVVENVIKDISTTVPKPAVTLKKL
jgi:hypothetical protein